ncbi:hypothetical protein LSAT2_009775, partial [Lamellibrachia satsuma]
GASGGGDGEDHGDCGTGGDCDGGGSDSGGDVTDDGGECDVTDDCGTDGDCDGGGDVTDDDRHRRFACKYRRRSIIARGGVIRAGLLRFRVVTATGAVL